MINLNPQAASIKSQLLFPSFSFFLKRAEEQEGLQLEEQAPLLPAKAAAPSALGHITSPSTSKVMLAFITVIVQNTEAIKTRIYICTVL